MRATWNEDEQTVVRIGQITEFVLDEHPDATIGRLTAAERAGIDAGRTTNEGNVIVVPVNAGVEMDDFQAVRLSEGLSMLIGHRVPDSAIMARAFCFREPQFEPHEAEDTVIRWGFPIELRAAPTDEVPDDGDDILNCPSCGMETPIDGNSCQECGYRGVPFNLPRELRRGFTAPQQQPIALHLTVNGETVRAEVASPVQDPTQAEREEFYTEHGREAGVTLKKDDDGFFVTTHRARSKSYRSPSAIPKKDVEFIESTGKEQ